MEAGALSLLSRSASVSPVVLYLPQRSLLEIEDRVHLSSGTCPAETRDLGAPHYVPGARVPVPEWRLATQEEKSVLWSTTAPQAHRGVGVVQLLGPQLIKLFEKRSDIFERVDDADTLKHPLIGCSTCSLAAPRRSPPSRHRNWSAYARARPCANSCCACRASACRW